MDGREEGQADILTLVFFGSAVDGSIGDSNHTTAGCSWVPPSPSNCCVTGASCSRRSKEARGSQI